jgi:hypothetical protein
MAQQTLGHPLQHFAQGVRETCRAHKAASSGTCRAPAAVLKDLLTSLPAASTVMR